jgi:hypothetical protein
MSRACSVPVPAKAYAVFFYFTAHLILVIISFLRFCPVLSNRGKMSHWIPTAKPVIRQGWGGDICKFPESEPYFPVGFS